MIIVSLGKYIDELFGEITHNLQLFIFLLSKNVTVTFPLDGEFLVEFAHVNTELLNDLGVLVLLVLKIDGRHVVVAPGCKEVHELDIFSA